MGTHIKQVSPIKNNFGRILGLNEIMNADLFPADEVQDNNENIEEENVEINETELTEAENQEILSDSESELEDPSDELYLPSSSENESSEDESSSESNEEASNEEISDGKEEISDEEGSDNKEKYKPNTTTKRKLFEEDEEGSDFINNSLSKIAKRVEEFEEFIKSPVYSPIQESKVKDKSFDLSKIKKNLFGLNNNHDPYEDPRAHDFQEFLSDSDDNRDIIGESEETS